MCERFQTLGPAIEKKWKSHNFSPGILEHRNIAEVKNQVAMFNETCSTGRQKQNTRISPELDIFLDIERMIGNCHSRQIETRIGKSRLVCGFN